MNLKSILFASALLASSAGFSQNLQYSVSGRLEVPFLKRIKVSAELNLSPKEINFTFFDNSMKFCKPNDSTYNEIVDNKDFYEYTFKDSIYTFKKYSSSLKPRKEKEVLEGRVFEDKYKSLPDFLGELIDNKLKDTLNFIVLGNPYSASIKKIKKGNNTVYIGNPLDFIRKEEGDKFHFKFPIKVECEEINGKNVPLKFSTKCLYIPIGLVISIEGKLK